MFNVFVRRALCKDIYMHIKFYSQNISDIFLNLTYIMAKNIESLGISDVYFVDQPASLK